MRPASEVSRHQDCWAEDSIQRDRWTSSDEMRAHNRAEQNKASRLTRGATRPYSPKYRSASINMAKLIENPAVVPLVSGPASNPADRPVWDLDDPETGTWGGFSTPGTVQPGQPSFEDVSLQISGGLSGGGLIRGYQDGGLADLMPSPGELEFSDEFVETPSGVDMFSEVEGDFDDNTLRYFAEEAKEAIRGTHPNGEQFLEFFVELFGREMLEELRQVVAAEDSDGMSDSIPANIDGVEEIAVSEGEYVVPARAVASLGNGSTEAGGRVMDNLVGDIQQATTGSRELGEPINPEDLLPKAVV